MNALFETMGGRKITVLFFFFMIVSANDWFKMGLSEESIEQLMYALIGVTGAMAVDDVSRNIANGKKASEAAAKEEKASEDTVNGKKTT